MLDLNFYDYFNNLLGEGGGASISQNTIQIEQHRLFGAIANSINLNPGSGFNTLVICRIYGSDNFYSLQNPKLGAEITFNLPEIYELDQEF